MRRKSKIIHVPAPAAGVDRICQAEGRGKERAGSIKIVRSVHNTRLREELQLYGSSRKMTGPGSMRRSYRKRSTRVMLDGGRDHRESGSPTCPVDSQDNGGAEHRGERPTGTDGCFEE